MNNIFYDKKVTYKNGNYIVYSAGGSLIKRPFRTNEELISDFPDSIDLKISNRCPWKCSFCHESSTPEGKIADISKVKEVLSELPEGIPIEIAIGGGDVLETPKETREIINFLNKRGHEPRITVNVQDIFCLTEESRKIIESVGGLGISLTSLPPLKKSKYGLIDEEFSLSATLFDENLQDWTRRGPFPNTKIIIHIIAGVFPASQLDDLFKYSEFPILILGYKQWGRAKNTALPESLGEFESAIKQQICKQRRKDYSKFYLSKVIGFDNLALEQLDIKSSLTDEEWGVFYMGDEGKHSMYIDAVEGKFARTSRSEKRVSWDDTGLIEYFKSL